MSEENKRERKKGRNREKILKTNSLKTKLTFQAQLQAINMGCQDKIKRRNEEEKGLFYNFFFGFTEGTR